MLIGRRNCVSRKVDFLNTGSQSPRYPPSVLSNYPLCQTQCLWPVQWLDCSQCTRHPTVHLLKASYIQPFPHWVFLKWSVLTHSEHSPVSETQVTCTFCIFLGKTNDLGNRLVINGKVFCLLCKSAPALWWADIKSELLNSKYDLPTSTLLSVKEIPLLQEIFTECPLRARPKATNY